MTDIPSTQGMERYRRNLSAIYVVAQKGQA